MITKIFRKEKGVFLVLCIVFLVLQASATAAVNVSFKIAPNYFTIESGSADLVLNVQAVLDSKVWVSGLDVNIGNPDIANSGFSTDIFYNNKVVLSGQPGVNSYKWGAINDGPNYNQNIKGSIICSKYVKPDDTDPNNAPLNQGINLINNPAGLPITIPLYSVGLTAIDEKNAESNAEIKFNPVAGNNLAQYYDQNGGDEKYKNCALTTTDQTLKITPAEAPKNFAGPVAANDLQKGNSLTITWNALSNQRGVSDWTPPVTYDIYYGIASNFVPDDNTNRIAAGVNGESYLFNSPTNGQGNLIFKDRTPYYFKMRAKDNTINKDSLGIHKTSYADNVWVEGIPHDYQSPAEVGNALATPSDKTLQITFNNPAEDFAGVMILKNENNANPPALFTPAYYKNLPADNPEYSLNKDGDLYSIGMDLAEGWKVVAYGNVNSYLDQNLSNGKTYYYLIYTFDPANEYQQGRNYSAGVKISGVPGQKPAAVKNLVALTSGEAEILLQWEIANKSEYGGSIIRYATDNSKKWDAVPNFEADPNFIPTIDQPDQNPGDPNAVTEKYLLPNLTPDLTHYFQVYSYNQAEDPLNRKYADIGAKGAAVPGKPAAAGTISNFKINSFNIANKQITLTWDITAGKVCEVYKSTDPKVFTAANLIQGGAGINAYTYTLGPQETEAYFRVKISGDNQPWAPETLGVKKFNLIKNTTGINSIAIPFVQFSADSLKESINNQAGKEIVEYVAGWDETNQKEYARIYSGGQIKNIGNKANFVISPWVGYQISVNESMNNWWVNGKVSGK